MVMPSHTTLPHSRTVREEWMEAFMNMMLGIMNYTSEESMRNNRKCCAGMKHQCTLQSRSFWQTYSKYNLCFRFLNQQKPDSIPKTGVCLFLWSV